MPQLFQVLRCYKCLVFQVHQSKKSNKFECKICGEKQSIKRHYGLGTGQECRLHVQKLNGIRGEVEELRRNKTPNSDEENVELDTTSQTNIPKPEIKEESKWSNYVEKSEVPVVDTTNAMYLNNTEVVLELPQKRKTLFGNNHRKKFTKTVKCNENLDEELFNDEYVPRIPSSCKIEPIQTTVPEYSISTNPSLVCQELNVNKKVMPKFKPPTNKNSKWAHFADEEENTIEDINEEIHTIDQSQVKANELFTLCDDCDLYDVLDI